MMDFLANASFNVLHLKYTDNKFLTQTSLRTTNGMTMDETTTQRPHRTRSIDSYHRSAR